MLLIKQKKTQRGLTILGGKYATDTIDTFKFSIANSYTYIQYTSSNNLAF